MSLVLGVDEAGRGSLIGPLVLCGFLIDEKKELRLLNIGVKDSKVLSRSAREEMALELIGMAKGIFLEEIPPSLIDRRNVTSLEMEAFVRIVNRAKPERAIFDAPVPKKGIPSLVSRLSSLIPFPVLITAENGADASFPVVSAASIMAKVVRDEAIAMLSVVYGSFGSGYPGDGTTRKAVFRWLEKGHFPPCVRKKWKTVREIPLFAK